MPRQNRDDFSSTIVRTLAQRAGYRCSNPACRRPTEAGAAADPARGVTIGVAAHITAAALGGPRYDAALAPAARAAIDNGIWLCATCAALIDKNNGSDYSTTQLWQWKAAQEAWAQAQLQQPTHPTDAISPEAAACGDLLTQLGGIVEVLEGYTLATRRAVAVAQYQAVTALQGHFYGEPTIRQALRDFLNAAGILLDAQHPPATQQERATEITRLQTAYQTVVTTCEHRSSAARTIPPPARVVENQYLCGQRLRQVREALTLQPSEIVAEIGYPSEQEWRAIEAERAECPDPVLLRFAAATGTNAAWLRHGQGVPYRAALCDPLSPDFLPTLHAHAPQAVWIWTEPGYARAILGVQTGRYAWQVYDLNFGLDFWNWDDQFYAIPLIYRFLERLHQVFADSIYSTMYPKRTLTELQTGKRHPHTAARTHRPSELFWAEAITNLTLDAPRRHSYGPDFVRIQECFQRSVTLDPAKQFQVPLGSAEEES